MIKAVIYREGQLIAERGSCLLRRAVVYREGQLFTDRRSWLLRGGRY